MEQKIVIISIFLLFLTFTSCFCQENPKSIWILYDCQDTLCHKAGIKEWYFFKSPEDNEPYRFTRIMNNNPDTLRQIPKEVSLIDRDALAALAVQEQNRMIQLNKYKKTVAVNLNWFNEIYDMIYIVEPKNGHYLIFTVKYNYCIF